MPVSILISGKPEVISNLGSTKSEGKKNSGAKIRQKTKRNLNAKTIRLPKVSTIKPLSEEVRKSFNEINKLYPGVELGYYSLAYQTIIIGNLPGDLSIAEAFSPKQQSWYEQVLINWQRVIIQTGSGETGALSGYAPVIKAGKVLGVIWAKQDLDVLLADIERGRRNAYGIMILGLVAVIGGTALFISSFVERVKGVKTGLEILKGDLHYILPESPGEIGEISASINNLSDEILRMKSYTEIILDSIEEGILAVNQEGRVIIINHAAVHLLALDNTNTLGQELMTVLGEGELADILWNTLSKEKGLREKKLIYKLTTGQVELLASTAVLRDYRGKFLGVALTIQDITEREKLLTILRRNERLSALGKLVAGVAHEIRNPLTSISGYVQLWLKKPSEEHPSEKSLKTINREINRLNDLVEKLLFFSKPGKTNMVNQAPDAIRLLTNYTWPGNIRELENICERSVIMASGSIILPEHIPMGIQTERMGIDLAITCPRLPLKEIVADIERQVILKVLEETNWNRSSAAENLGLNRRSLYAKMKEYNLEG